MTRYEGRDGQLSVEGDTLVLTREGWVARNGYGKNVSPRRIPLTAISGVRSRPATRLRYGWLQLLIGGVDGGKPGLTENHPDRVWFTWDKHEQFEELERLLVQTAERNNAHGDPAAASANADAGTAGPTLRETLAAPPSLPAPLQRMVDAHEAALAEQGILFQGTSHDEGRNAVITLYQDRIERRRGAKLSSLSFARQDMEETPLRAISSIGARKDGIRTKVTIYASGNNIVFRFDHNEAERFRRVLGPLIRGGHSAAPTAPQPAGPAPAPSLAEQLRDLAALRDEGVLTDDEFAAQKAKLLGT